MALTEKDVRYVASLAHLELTEAEVTQFLPQLDAILQYIGKLNELDTARVEPMAQVSVAAPENAALRPDLAQKCFSQEEALSNAPERREAFFSVPRVIEKE
ncbi:MAG TPA: Asp-tRNA(Asn)/Glu-tRNA(Gln) amidotransferase subunit GatC [Terriglobia bacterium]|nr:Asp-tRNA(Asn)/Glu-tRNA(Gln) amidotransferase subunit GatC [Terriglobia bacterium]